MRHQVGSTKNPPGTTDISSLLKNVEFTVGTLRKARKQYSAQLAPDFNIFNFLRRNEMGLSSVLADLLDPKGTPGQGGVFLDRFFKKLNQESEHRWITSVCDWHVTTEKTISDKRRIDVFMKSENGLIAIENKPWAGDQKDQLKDYGEYLDDIKGNRNWLLIYLGNNSTPSEDSLPNNLMAKWKQSQNLRLIDYYFLVGWLDECAGLTKAFPVRIFIEELAKFVRKEVNGEMDMYEQHEVINEILKSQENIAGAFHVANAINQLKRSLLEKFKKDLEVACQAKNYIPEWDKGNTMDSKWPRYSGFGVKFDTTHRLYLRIQFEDVDLGSAIWGICKLEETDVYDDIIWNNIKGVMSHKFGQGCGNGRWPWWSTDSPRMMRLGGHDKAALRDYENWNTSPDPWIDMDNDARTLVANIIRLADEVKDAFNDSLDLLRYTPPKIAIPMT